MPAVRQAGGLSGGRGLDAGHLDRGVVLQLRCLELGECSDQRRVEADGVRGGDLCGRGDGPVVVRRQPIPERDERAAS